MDIKNFTQFAHLISAKQIIHLNPAFDKLVMCMMLYNGMCSCGGNSDRDKQNKAGECNRIYRESLATVDRFKAHFFQGCVDQTISFYVDDIHHIKTICR